MDYESEQRIKRGQISYDLERRALPYGEMPPEALMAKFDETNDLSGNCDEVYDFYARNTLTDRSPDDATFAHEEERKSISNKGYLNLIHSGTRSGGEVAHPEIFLGLTEGEPRGIAVDPDFKELRKQAEARTRFVYLGNDADPSITGGGWNEAQVQEAGQTIFKWMRPRLRIFSTSKDGRREGIRRMYQHKPNIGKIDDQSGYGELIKDWALNPQRATTIFSNRLIRNTRQYHQFTTDHDFKVSHYGDGARSRVHMNKHNAISDVEADYEFNSEDMSKCFKAMGILMGQCVAREVTPDMDYGENGMTQIRKQKDAHEDLMQLLYAIRYDADFSGSDKTMMVKTPAMKRAAHGKRVVDAANHLTPAHVLLNGMIMSKGVKPSADLSQVRKNIVMTPDDPNIRNMVRDAQTQMGKTTRVTIMTGKRHSEIVVDGESVMVPHYKTTKQLGNTRRQHNTSGEHINDVNHGYAAGDGNGQDNTQNRATSHTNYRNPTTEEVNQDSSFSANTSQERRIAPMGTKYTMREVDTDAKNNSISDIS